MRKHVLTVSILVLASFSRTLLAQSSAEPTVTIHAAHSPASEAQSTPGTFTVQRTGPTNFPLLVFYRLSGTASNGVDYEHLGNNVQIPVGALAASFNVKPIDDNLVEGTESVLAEVTGSPLACATCGYRIGDPGKADMLIFDNDPRDGTNDPPFLRFNEPQAGDVFRMPANVTLRAYAQDDEDHFNLHVEFLDGTSSLGFGEFIATLCPAPYCPFFELTWSNVPPGEHVLRARVTDSHGATTVSDPVSIVVIGAVNIYATDPEGSEIHSAPNIDPPSNPAVFTVRRFGATDEDIVAYYDISGTASNGVDYVKLPGYVNLPQGVSSAQVVIQPIADNLVEGTETVVLTLQPTCPQCLFVNPIWRCLPPQGTNCYALGPDQSAVAYIRDGNAPPGTNVAVVSIVATDALAVEGPFCRSNWWWTTAWNAGNWVISPALGDWNSPIWRTNLCSGVNTATFSVRRAGPTNTPLTVYYSIGGTASNGIDYVRLPGQIIIPSGQRSADIEVMPVEDSIREHVESVTLKLVPPPGVENTLPSYVIGTPKRAAALIVDNDLPRPPCRRLPDGLFHLCSPGTNGHHFTVRASTDLANWEVICSNTVTDGAVHFVDPDATDVETRFYRVDPEPATTLE